MSQPKKEAMKFLVPIVNLLFSIYYVLLILRASLPRFKRLNALTDPVLRIIRLGLPPQQVGWDASPAVALFLLFILQRLIWLFW